MEQSNILIVGASSGIGGALYQKLTKSDYSVYTAGRRNVASQGHLQFDAQTGSFTVPDGWPEVFHGLVYCPGTITLKPIGRLTREDFLLDYQINVLGFVEVVQAMLSRLKKANGSSVVIFGSVAVQIGLGFHASIAAAKGALQSLAISLASELAPSNIRVNVVAPSLTRTQLAASLLNTPEKEEASAKRHPLQRIGNVGDMAAAAQFLLSQEANWITGQTLGVDGGLGRLK